MRRSAQRVAATHLHFVLSLTFSHAGVCVDNYAFRIISAVIAVLKDPAHFLPGFIIRALTHDDVFDLIFDFASIDAPHTASCCVHLIVRVLGIQDARKTTGVMPFNSRGFGLRRRVLPTKIAYARLHRPQHLRWIGEHRRLRRPQLHAVCCVS